MPAFHFVPASEFARIRALDVMDVARAELFAALCRINVLYMIAAAGSGHIGTSFSCLDVLTWLYLYELQFPPSRSVGVGDGDICYSSKGHDAPAVYAVLTGLGLLDFELIHRLRRENGLPGHPDVGTPYIPTNTGSLGMGISKAKGMVLANRLLGRSSSVYVITGDGELQEGQIWESLTSAVRHCMGEITVIVDANQIQSDTFVKDVSDLRDLSDKFMAFGWKVARCNGHNFQEFKHHFSQLKTIKNCPKVLIADTLKGKGVSFMEPTAIDPVERLYKYHSGAPNEHAYAHAFQELLAHANSLLHLFTQAALRTETTQPHPLPVPASPQRLVRAYSDCLVEQAATVPNLVALDADLVLDCGLIPFSKRFPDRFFECGIAEQDMVSVAGGMALRGLLPVVHSFACFLTPRANEQIYNNATERTRIIYVGSLAGLLPGAPGHSHQSVRDISVLAAIPDLDLIEPCCEDEVRLALHYAVSRSRSSVYIRLVSIPLTIPFRLSSDYCFERGRGVFLRQGSDALVISAGPVLLTEAFVAAESLSSLHGINVAIVNLPWLNRFDSDWLRSLVSQYSIVVTLDNHYTIGSQGEMLAARIHDFQLSSPLLVRRLGVDRIPTCGTNQQVLASHKLDAASLREELLSLIQSHKGNLSA